MPVKFLHLIIQDCTSIYDTKLLPGGTTEKQIRRFCRFLPDYVGKISPKE